MSTTIHPLIVKIFCWLYIIASIFEYWCLVVLSILFHYFRINTYVAFVIIGILFVSTSHIGFSGLYALKIEDGVKMKMFGIIVIILIIMQSLVLIGMLVFLCVSRHFIKKVLYYWMESYSTNSESTIIIDTIQSIFQCCGRNGYSDWGPMIPLSCCADSLTCDSWNQLGCMVVMDHLALACILSAAIALIGVIAFHILTARLSFRLARVFQEQEHLL